MQKSTPELTAEEAREVIQYDRDSGNLYWINSRCHTTKNGEIAGCIDKTNGYRVVRVLAKKYYVHRLAFLLETGAWPSKVVDHINGDRTDNRWVNLREATRSQNQMNAKLRCDNKSGVRGVSFSKQYGTWKVQVKGASEAVAMTRYCLEDAAEAAEAARAALHGEFARKHDGR